MLERERSAVKSHVTCAEEREQVPESINLPCSLFA